MCKLCDLEFQERVRKFIGRTDMVYRDYPEDIKEYMKWCSKELASSEGVYLYNDSKGTTMVVNSDDPFCAGLMDIKFCPNCGRKLDAEELNGKE